MPTNVVIFNRAVASSKAEVDAGILRLQKQQVVAFVELVATLMPVKSGHARANIITSANKPNTKENFADDGGLPLDILTILFRTEQAIKNLKPYQEVFVNFNAPYTSFLNDGRSTQAAKGFIENAAASVNARFK